jgi:Kef-type K+ transport system membrane component KefB
LFAIGGEIELNHLRSMGRRVIYIALIEGFGAFILVFTASWLISGDWGVAVLLGAVSIASAPSVALLVIREYRARGPLTDTLLAVVALDNVLCLIVFRLFFSVFALSEGSPLTAVLIELGTELIGSLIIGGVIAAIITFWEQKIDDLSELLLVIIGGLLLGIGAARSLGISPLMICLVIGDRKSVV